MTHEPATGDFGIQLDETFFVDLLPRVRDLAGLKVILHVMHLSVRSGVAAVPFDDLLAPALVQSISGGQSAEPGTERVRQAVERMLADGHLLQLAVESDGGRRVLLLAATPANRTLLEQMRDGAEGPEFQLGLPPGIAASIYRPNVFSLYERHIGPLTPLVADQLREAERAYPRLWIEEAIGLAVESRKRSWRYIQAILTRWEDDGAPTGRAGRKA
jgi:DNA replication protein